MNLMTAHRWLPPQLPMVLASQSPRRQALLAEVGLQFVVDPPRRPEATELRPGESPYAFVARLACDKAEEVAARWPRGLIVACDTVAVCRGEILGKPRDAADAQRMLRALRGTEHQVVSGLCLWPMPVGQPMTRVERTWLAMDPLDDKQVADYVASDQWRGKAGGFGFQDQLGWVRIVSGSASNVVGLPMELLAEMLVPFQVDEGQVNQRPVEEFDGLLSPKSP